ncbi:MAG: hypothetical protein EXS13_07555 [Planctomycetes bacterium]|nr:hypothetical protein [Planctomycetota bacterium]
MRERNICLGLRAGRAAIAFVTLAGGAVAQESPIFSLSASATAPWGTLADTELARFDPGLGRCVPWLSIATGACFGGDINGDGATDDWKDIDAVWVGQSNGEVSDVYISFNTTHGPWLDGDVMRLKEDGTLQLVFSESQIAAWFGLTDGQQDLDALHVAIDGRVYMSFGDDEASALLSTDVANVVTDGSIVVWDPSRTTASVVLTETQIDARISTALKKTQKCTDTLGIAMDKNGALCFSVQSPSTDDATTFRDLNGGEVLLSESALLLGGTPEIDALDLVDGAVEFLAARITPRLVAGNVQAQVDLDGPPNHLLIVTLSFKRGDSLAWPGKGFFGLLLDPNDPLFSASLADLPWTYSKTDAAGHAFVLFDPAPPGVVLTVFAQAYDFDGRAFGTPIAIELIG